MHETDARPMGRRHPPGRQRRRLAALAICVALLPLTLAQASTSAAADRDGDSLRDAFEARSGGLLDPSRADSDGDGVIDSAEDDDGDRLGNLGEQRFGTLPGVADSDGDGLADGREDSDRDGRPDALEQDRRPLPRGLQPTLERAADDRWAGTDRCGGPRWGDARVRTCWYVDAQSPLTLAVVGDSKATMWMPAILAAAHARGWRVVTLLKGTCSPVLGTQNAQQHDLDGGRSCDRWRRNVIGWLGRTPPDVILVAHSDDYGLVDPRGRVISGVARQRVWEAGAARTVAALPDPSRVVWLGDVPANRGNPVRCLKEHRTNISACVARRLPLGARSMEVALRKGVTRSGGRTASLHDQVCSYDPCPIVHGRTLLWRDDAHLTATFSRALAPSMGRLLDAALTPAP